MFTLVSMCWSDATDQLEQKVIEFFVNAKKNKPEWREEQMEVIKKVCGRSAANQQSAACTGRSHNPGLLCFPGLL